MDYDSPTDRLAAALTFAYLSTSRILIRLFVAFLAVWTIAMVLALITDDSFKVDPNRTCVQGEKFTDGQAPNWWSDGSGVC